MNEVLFHNLIELFHAVTLENNLLANLWQTKVKGKR